MGKSKLLLTPADEGMFLTREEYAEADWTPPYRYERKDGRLVVMPGAGFEHHSTVEPFRDYLGAFRLAHPDVIQHVFQESWTAVGDDTDRLPDIAVYLAGDDVTLPDRVPDLVFEIVSEGKKARVRDYDEKREEYEQIGVKEYVIVDRFNHQATVLRLTGGGFSESTLGPDDTYSTPLLPGLEIPLAGVL